MMTAIFVSIAFLIKLVLSTGVFLGALLVTGEEAVTKETIGKCLGITILALLVSLLPFVGWLSGIVWLGALMVVFEKEFLEALIIAIACLMLNILIGFVIGAVLTSVGAFEVAV